jgi:hypothetical protein
MSDTENGRREETAEQKRAWLEWFERQKADYFWCLNQVDLRERYAGQVVMMHRRVVLGSGASVAEARDEAKRCLEARGETLPSESDLLIMIVPSQLWMDAPLPYPDEDSPAPAPARADAGGAP